MDRDTLNQKRKELSREIESAKSLLKSNLDHIDISSYIIPRNSLAPMASSIISNPTKIIGSLNRLSRISMGPSNIVRRILKYLTLLTKGLNILRK